MTPAGIRAILAHDEAVPAELVADHILPDAGVEVVEICDVLYPAPETMRSSDADVLLIGCAEGSEDALRLVDWWTASRPGRPVVVLCEGHSNGFVDEAFAAGADDLLVLDSGPFVAPASARHVGFAVQKAVARKVGPTELSEATGKLICVLGSEGRDRQDDHLLQPRARAGACATSAVVLVDLDLQFGDVALSLGLTPDTTVYDLAVSGGEPRRSRSSTPS